MPRLPTPEEAARRQREEETKRALVRAYAELFADERGRLVLADIGRRAFLQRSVARVNRAGQTDLFLTGVNEGYRMAYTEIINHIRAGQNLGEPPRQTVAESETIR